ncbi:MAG: hypothetical protein ACXWKI_11415 [Ramlibacter sp.]
MVIALCAGLQAVQAAQPGPQANSTVAMATPGELHAQLATHTAMAPSPRATHGTEIAAASTSLQASGGGHTAPQHEHRPTTAAMLLAALALMTGIALRRWGAGQQ